MRSFNNKVAAITGAASGMGRQLAVQLARHGCHLALSDVNESGLAETQVLARQANRAIRISVRTLDVSDRKAVFDWADATAREHGKVNLIFNNAGVGLASTAEATWHWGQKGTTSARSTRISRNSATARGAVTLASPS